MYFAYNVNAVKILLCVWEAEKGGHASCMGGKSMQGISCKKGNKPLQDPCVDAGD